MHTCELFSSSSWSPTSDLWSCEGEGMEGEDVGAARGRVEMGRRLWLGE